MHSCSCIRLGRIITALAAILSGTETRAAWRSPVSYWLQRGVCADMELLQLEIS